jgi:hypothetical protein
MICFLPVTVEPFQFSPAEPVAYELSKTVTSVFSMIGVNFRYAIPPGIFTHETTVAFDIGAENGGKFTFTTFLRHRVTPILYGFKSEKKLRNKLYQKNTA